MWEWRQQPAGMQLRALAQILNLALVLVLEWIWVLVQVGVGRQNMKTDVDGRREGGGTDGPAWMMRRGWAGWTIDTVWLTSSYSFVPADAWCNSLWVLDEPYLRMDFFTLDEVPLFKAASRGPINGKHQLGLLMRDN